MGDMSDSIEWFVEDFSDVHLDGAREGIWTMKDGEEIAVQNMSDTHIRNAINLVQKRSDIFSKEAQEAWVKTFESALSISTATT